MTEKEYNTVMFSQVEEAQRANSKDFGYMLLRSWLAPIRDTIDPEENLIQRGEDKAEQRPDLAQVVQDKAAVIDKSKAIAKYIEFVLTTQRIENFSFVTEEDDAVPFTAYGVLRQATDSLENLRTSQGTESLKKSMAKILNPRYNTISDEPLRDQVAGLLCGLYAQFLEELADYIVKTSEMVDTDPDCVNFEEEYSRVKKLIPNIGGDHPNGTAVRSIAQRYEFEKKHKEVKALPREFTRDQKQNIISKLKVLNMEVKGLASVVTQRYRDEQGGIECLNKDDIRHLRQHVEFKFQSLQADVQSIVQQRSFLSRFTGDEDRQIEYLWTVNNEMLNQVKQIIESSAKIEECESGDSLEQISTSEGKPVGRAPNNPTTAVTTLTPLDGGDTNNDNDNDPEEDNDNYD